MRSALSNFRGPQTPSDFQARGFTKSKTETFKGLSQDFLKLTENPSPAAAVTALLSLGEHAIAKPNDFNIRVVSNDTKRNQVIAHFVEALDRPSEQGGNAQANTDSKNQAITLLKDYLVLAPASQISIVATAILDQVQDIVTSDSGTTRTSIGSIWDARPSGDNPTLATFASSR
ncbi:MAG: hypothetical protein ACI9BD_001262 [Candidatus Marinamargulisbacteria bacterium]|jgi:hypothetical protein